MPARSVKDKDSKPPQNIATWVVYIVQCADGTFYTGISNNLERRLKQHNAGTASRYTRYRLPVTLIYQEVQPTKSAALKRELEIKKLSRKAKQRLINEGT
jgi:predicted GIY-YIG superfamily endonuclease